MIRRPSLGLAEISWRWSLGFATALVLLFSFVEYLDSLPVTNADLLLLRSRQPFLISHAILHIFSGSGPRAVAAGLVLIFAMTVAWIGTASLGRGATLNALVDYFGEDKIQSVRPNFSPADGMRQFRSLVGLNSFRVGVTLAAFVGCVGVLLLAGFTSSKADPSPGSTTLIFLTLVMAVWLAWAILNWFLSLAAIFVVTEGNDTFGAVASAVEFCRARTGSVLAAGTWFEIAHLVVFVVASSMVAFPLAFSGVLPAGVIVGGVLFVALWYFAIVDFLYVGRLAAYLAVLSFPEESAVSQTVQPSAPDSSSQSSLIPQSRSGVDADEVILSDV